MKMKADFSLSSFFYFSLLLLSCFPVVETRIHPNAEIRLMCPEAVGTVGCDWRCYDKCVAPYGPYVNVDLLSSCLSEIGAECSIPGTALVTISPNWFCSSPAAGDNSVSDMESQGSTGNGFDRPQNAYAGYIVEIPEFESSRLRVQQAHTADISIDIAATFDSDLCRSVASYVMSANQDVPKMDGEFDYLPGVKKCGRVIRIQEVPGPAAAGFGFHLLNLNFTKWAMDYEAQQGLIGDVPLTMDFATTHTCWAPATNITVFHAMGFTILSHDFEGGVRSKNGPAFTFLLIMIIAFDRVYRSPI